MYFSFTSDAVVGHGAFADLLPRCAPCLLCAAHSEASSSMQSTIDQPPQATIEQLERSECWGGVMMRLPLGGAAAFAFVGSHAVELQEQHMHGTALWRGCFAAITCHAASNQRDLTACQRASVHHACHRGLDAYGALPACSIASTGGGAPKRETGAGALSLRYPLDKQWITMPI